MNPIATKGSRSGTWGRVVGGIVRGIGEGCDWTR